MGKMKFLVLASALMLAVPTIAGAIQTNSIDVVKDVNQDTAVQIREAGTAAAVDTVTKLVDRYITNFRTCEPIHISHSTNLFGLKINYQFDVNGWVDNKCSYYMTGNIGALGNDIREVFEIKASDELVAKIKPDVRCNFTREQLDILVDGFIAAQERKVSQKAGLAEEKTSTGKAKLSPAEEKMMEMLMSSGACSLTNQDELMQHFTELMGTFQPPTSTSKPAPEVSTPSTPEEPVAAPSVESGAEAPAVEKPVLRQEGPKVNMPGAPTF